MPRLAPSPPQVPRSTRRVAEDNDYVLMSVVLFKRVADDFKTAARVKGFQVGGGVRRARVLACV